MSGVQIIRQTSIDYSDVGAAGYSTDSFIKIGIDFKTSGALRLLKGAPLSVFVCLALHEADNQPGASLTILVNETGYSRPTVSDAVQFLQVAEHRFIDECGTERDGTQRYRVSAYAWFGGNRPRSGKKFLPPAVQKTFSPVVDVVDSKQISEKEQQQQLFCAESKKFFHEVGIGEPALSKLSAVVVPERAEMWCDWLSDPPKSFKFPAAYLVKQLSGDPSADPPGWTLALWQKWCAEDEAQAAQDAELDVEIAAEATSPRNDAQQTESRYRQDGTGDIWHAVLSELQLQMTKATFDTWVHQSHALGWDGESDDQLVVSVPSPYAKEWLENRLATTVQRTVTGIVGHTVTVRYEVANGCER